MDGRRHRASLTQLDGYLGASHRSVRDSPGKVHGRKLSRPQRFDAMRQPNDFLVVAEGGRHFDAPMYAMPPQQYARRTYHPLFFHYHGNKRTPRGQAKAQEPARDVRCQQTLNFSLGRYAGICRRGQLDFARSTSVRSASGPNPDQRNRRPDYEPTSELRDARIKTEAV